MKPEHLNKKKREDLIKYFRSAWSKPNSFSGIPQDNESWTEVTRCRYWAVFDVSPSHPFPKVIHECTKHMYSFMLQGEFNWCLLLLGDQNISLSLISNTIPTTLNSCFGHSERRRWCWWKAALGCKELVSSCEPRFQMAQPLLPVCPL